MRINEGVSEVVGSILLVSLVVLAVAIIGVGFLSQPPPVQTQELNVIAGNDTTTLYLYHDGGDPMVPGEFKILLDGIDKTPEITEAWDIGETLNIPITQRPERIQIISTRGGQQNLIREISIGQVTGGGAPIPPGPPPTPGECTQEELDEYLEDNYVEYFSNKLSDDAIYFTRLERGPTGPTYARGWINFTINSTDSYLIRSGTTEPLDLNMGDTVSINFRDIGGAGDSVDLFSVGNKGWSLSGGATHIYVNDTLYSGNLIDSWITSFINYQSTLKFKSVGTGQGVRTRLIIKNETVIDAVNSNDYEFINIKPAEPTLLVLHFPKQQGDPIRFIGQVDQIKEGTTIIYP